MHNLYQWMKMGAQRVVLPFWYQLFCRRKVRPGSVLFADAHHERRPENMDLVFNMAAKSGNYRITQIYLDYQKAPFFTVLKSMLRFMRLYATSQTVVICDNFLPAASCRCRKETLVIQLWHACGCLKKFGYDSEDDIPSSYHGHVFRNTGAVTVSAPAVVKPFSGAMRLPESCILPVGVSRTDLYFRSKWREDRRRRFYETYPQARGRRVAAAAPTFRGSAASPKRYLLDAARLQENLGDEYFLLLSLHPHMRAQEKDNAFISRISTQDLFPVTDVLIADYSSLIYEYLLFDRPLVLYTPDLEEYVGKRGFYMDYEEFPAVRVREEKDLAGAVREACSMFYGDGSGSLDEWEKKRRRVLDRYMSSCDGNSTARIFELMESHRKNGGGAGI